jgi:hypothetical protein
MYLLECNLLVELQELVTYPSVYLYNSVDSIFSHWSSKQWGKLMHYYIIERSGLTLIDTLQVPYSLGMELLLLTRTSISFKYKCRTLQWLV